MNRLLRIGIVAALLALVPAFDSPASATSRPTVAAVPNGQVLFGGGPCAGGDPTGDVPLYDGTGEAAAFQDLVMVGTFDDGEDATGASSAYAGGISMAAAGVASIPACVDDATCDDTTGCVDNPDSLVNAGVVFTTSPAFESDDALSATGNCVHGGIGATDNSSFLSVGVVAIVGIELTYEVENADPDCDPNPTLPATTVDSIAVMAVAPLDTIEDNCEAAADPNDCPTQNPILDPEGDGSFEQVGDIVAGVIVA